MVRLLHIGLTVGKNKWLSKELRKRTNYQEIRPSESDILIRALFDFHAPDCVFMQIQQANMINLGLIEYMSKRSVLINWSGDVREPLPEWYFDFDNYCISCFSNMRDVNLIKGEYLQIGIDHEIYYPKDLSNYRSDIVFMGNRSNGFPLSQYRLDTIEFLRKRYDLKVFGGWPGANANLMNSPDEEANYYRTSKIALSISHFDISRYFSDRLIRAMGSGCFTISHHYKDIEIDFEVGKHLETFKTYEELTEKIDYYLQNPKERNKIASAGCNHVHEKFTTKNMVNDILRIYEKNKSLAKLV